MGSCGRDHYRGDRSAEVASHPGVPLPALCSDGDRGAAVPAGRPAAPPGASLLSSLAVMTALLEARGLVKRFGGVVALDHFDFTLAANDVVGLIGPNGSGKTTFFNLVTGIYRADAGRIVFSVSDITGAAAPRVYRLGISRTFQRSRRSLPLSIFDNIMIGNYKRLRQGLWFNLVRRSSFRREFEANYAAARALLAQFEPTLAQRMFEPVAGLAMIDRR